MYSDYSRKTILSVAFENYASLAGLEGVHVITRYVSKSAKKHNISDMKTDLVEQIGERLSSVGLRMLDKEELKLTPGQPTLTFYPAYTGTQIDPSTLKSTPDTVVSDEIINAAGNNSCRSSIWASFLQSATILRDPSSGIESS